MVRQLIGNNKHPVILIEWSGLTACGLTHFIRASVAQKGRSLTLYEQPFSLSEYGSQKAHDKFLSELKYLLPSSCKPVLVTDAGFRCPWFKAVVSLGWDYVGRIRHNTLYRREDEALWHPVKGLYETASSKAQFIMKGFLAKGNPLSCYFYTMKEASKNRMRRNLAGKKIQCSVSKKHAKREREPWLIASSLSTSDYTPKAIINLYKKRMQIEGSFRDLKNTNNGLGLRHCRSKSIERLSVLLLLAAIANFLLWIVGGLARQNNQHYGYQANTTKNRAVLSQVMIGWQHLMRYQRLKWKDVLAYIPRLSDAEEGEIC